MKSTNKTPKLNVRLLRRIQKHILAEPRRFFMTWFIARGKPGGTLRTTYGPFNDLARTAPPCGTAACIAGWANLFTHHKPDNGSAAKQELGLSDDQADELFSQCEWPEPFRTRYDNAKTPSARARIACKRIDHLIKTGQ